MSKETTFVVGGINYRLRYSVARVEMIEAQSMGMQSLMGAIAKNVSLLPVALLRSCLTYGLIDSNGKYLEQAKAAQIANALLESEFTKANMAVIVAMQRDLPFFFQAD